MGSVPVPALELAPAEQAVAKRAPGKAVSVPRPQMGEVQAPNKPHPAGEMARRFNAAPSLRAFLYEAMRKPEQGGHHYAFVALAACDHVFAPAKPRAAPSVHQREAIAALARRCDMSKEENDAARAQLLSSRDLNVEPDTLIPLTFDLLMAGEPGERMTAFAAILETQDPYLLWSLAEAGSANPQLEKSKEIYFAGKLYPAGAGTGVYDLALPLVQCNFGVECGPGSLPVLLMCIERNWCGESLGEAMRRGLGLGLGLGPGPERGAEYAQAQALAAQLTYEIKRKNAGAFVAPR